MPSAAWREQRAGHDPDRAADEIQSAVIEGHVVLTRSRLPGRARRAEAPMRATAGRAVYEGVGEWLHLTLSPRVEDGGLQLTADKIDVSQEIGRCVCAWKREGDLDGDRNGQVRRGQEWPAGKACGERGRPGQRGVGRAGTGARDRGRGAIAPGRRGEITFRGHARLWQQANSVAAPVIVLDRQRQTLVARSTDAAEPVRAVLLSAGAAGAGQGCSRARRPRPR